MPVYACGLELGDKTAYQTLGYTVSSGVTVSSSASDRHNSIAGRGGSYGLLLGGTAVSFLSPVLFTAGAGRWMHFWVDTSPSLILYSGIEFRVSGGVTYGVRFDPASSTVQLRRGSLTGTFVASGGFNPNIPHWIAIEANLRDSGGQVTVFVDGVQVVQATGDTKNGATDDWEQWNVAGSNAVVHRYDDFIITSADEGRLGEHFLPPLIPSANDVIGSGAGSTGGAGSYANVDEIPPDDGTSYNEFTAPGTDRYVTANIGFTPSFIRGVMVHGIAARDGTIVGAQNVCATDSGGGGATEALGAVSGLGAAGVYSGYFDMFQTDPDTSSAITAVNQTTDTFTIAGNVAANIKVGSIIEVTGSTGNDGSWVVESVADVTTNTEITITGEVPDATADGNLTYNFTIAALDDLRVGVKFT